MIEEARAVQDLLSLPQASRFLVANGKRFCRAGVVRRLIAAAHELRFSHPAEMLQRAELATTIVPRCTDLPPRELSDLGAAAWAELGNAYKVRAAYRSCERALKRAIEHLPSGSGNPDLQARIVEYVAALRLRQSRMGEARESIGEALQLRANNSPHRLASTLCQASQIEHCAGDLITALDLATRAIDLIDSRIDPRLALIPRHNGIWILLDMGRKTEALKAFESLLPTYAYSADPLMLLRAHWLHARILSAFGRADMDALAVRIFRETVDDAVRRELPYEAAQLALELSLFYESRGRYDLLQESITEALAVFEAVGLGPETMVARLLARAGEMLSSARELLQRALHRLERHRRLL